MTVPTVPAGIGILGVDSVCTMNELSAAERRTSGAYRHEEEAVKKT
jgi:hypothetical protein